MLLTDGNISMFYREISVTELWGYVFAELKATTLFERLDYLFVIEWFKEWKKKQTILNNQNLIEMDCGRFADVIDTYLAI